MGRAGRWCAVLLGLGLGLGVMSPASAATAPGPVGLPGAVTLVDRIQLFWTAPSDGGSPLTGYNIYAQTQPTAAAQLIGSTAPDVTTLTVPVSTVAGAGTSVRWYSVRAVNAVGAGSGTALSLDFAADDFPFLRELGDGTRDLAVTATRNHQPPGAGSDVGVTLDGAGDHVGLATSRDAQWLAFGLRPSPTSGTDLYTIRTDGTSGRVLLAGEPGVEESAPTWAPDGTSVTYTRGSGASAALWRVPVTGGAPSGPATAVLGGAGLTDAQWAAAGGFLVARPSTGSGTLTRVDPVTGTRTAVAGTGGATAFAVSPRADAIAFVTQTATPGGTVLCQSLAPLGVTAPVRISTPCSTVAGNPRVSVQWDPDGATAWVTAISPPAGATPATTLRLPIDGITGAAGAGSSPSGTSPVWFTERHRAHHPAPGVLFSSAYTSQHSSVPFVAPIQLDGTRYPATCQLDTGTAQPCSSPFTGFLAAGNHTLALTIAGATTTYTWAVHPEARFTDRTGDGRPDLIAQDITGTIWPYPATTTGGIGTRTKFPNYGPGVTVPTGAVADYTDTIADLLILDSTGLLSSLADSPTQPQVNLATGWSTMTATLEPGDFDSTGTADLIARDSTGRLWLYPGVTTGIFAPALTYPTRRQIGTGWQTFKAIATPGDFNGDHHVDLVAVDTTGVLWLYPGTGGGAFLARKQIATGWAGFTAVVGPGDWDGDHQPDLITRDTTGRLWLYPGTGTGTLKTRRQIGTGWNNFKITS